MENIEDKYMQNRKKTIGEESFILRPTKFEKTHIIGVCLTGVRKGDEIKISYSGPLNHSECTNKNSNFYIEEGGTIFVNRAKKFGSRIECHWMYPFEQRPSSDVKIISDAQCSYFDTGQVDSKKRPIVFIDQLVSSREKTINNMDDLENAIFEGIKRYGCVRIFARDGDEAIQESISRTGQFVDKKWVRDDPALSAKKIVESLKDVEPDLQKLFYCGYFIITPTRRYLLDPDVAMANKHALKEANKKGLAPHSSTIDSTKWNYMSMGKNLVGTLNINAKEIFDDNFKSKLAKEFNLFADFHERRIFKEYGWKALSDDVISRFFKSMGIDIKDYSLNGWSEKALLIAESGNIAVNAVETGRINRYAPISIFHDLRQEYREEMEKILENVAAYLNGEKIISTDSNKKPSRLKKRLAEIVKDNHAHGRWAINPENNISRTKVKMPFTINGLKGVFNRSTPEATL